MLFRFTPISFEQASASPFAPRLTHSSRFTPIFTKFSNFGTICPNFCSFYASATLLTHTFCSFYLLATGSTLVIEFSLRGSDFGMQLSPKIGSLAKAFLLAPSLSSIVFVFCIPNSVSEL